MKEKDSHSHDHENGHGHEHHRIGNIKIATFLNIGFTIIEFIGGALTNSLAILTDALHDLGDSLVLLASWKAAKISAKKPDWQKTYGYRRFSILAAFLNAVILGGGSLLILFQIIGRIANPQPVSATGMIWLAVLGIVFNTLGSLRLRKGSVHEKILSWHLIEDVLGWVGILIAAIVIRYTGLYIIDPLITILFMGIVLWGVYRNSKELFNIFLEGAPGEKNTAEIVREVESVGGVLGVDDVHLWSLDGTHHIASVKARIKNKESLDHIRIKIEGIFAKNHIKHSTIELSTKPFTEVEQEFLVKK